MEQFGLRQPAARSNEPIAEHTDLLREKLGSALRIVNEIAVAPAPWATDQQISERDVRALQRMRRNRDQFFNPDLFADPAWDIFLELYAAALGQQRTSVTKLCEAAAVPATTALRWIRLLEEQGLLTRSSDPMDARRSFMQLSARALKGMDAYFRTVPSAAGVI